MPSMAGLIDVANLSVPADLVELIVLKEMSVAPTQDAVVSTAGILRKFTQLSCHHPLACYV